MGAIERELATARGLASSAGDEASTDYDKAETPIRVDAIDATEPAPPPEQYAICRAGQGHLSAWPLRDMTIDEARQLASDDAAAIGEEVGERRRRRRHGLSGTSTAAATQLTEPQVLAGATTGTSTAGLALVASFQPSVQRSAVRLPPRLLRGSRMLLGIASCLQSRHRLRDFRNSRKRTRRIRSLLRSNTDRESTSSQSSSLCHSPPPNGGERQSSGFSLPSALDGNSRRILGTAALAAVAPRLAARRSSAARDRGQDAHRLGRRVR